MDRLELLALLSSRPEPVRIVEFHAQPPFYLPFRGEYPVGHAEGARLLCSLHTAFHAARQLPKREPCLERVPGHRIEYDFKFYHGISFPAFLRFREKHGYKKTVLSRFCAHALSMHPPTAAPQYRYSCAQFPEKTLQRFRNTRTAAQQAVSLYRMRSFFHAPSPHSCPPAVKLTASGGTAQSGRQ